MKAAFSLADPVTVSHPARSADGDSHLRLNLPSLTARGRRSPGQPLDTGTRAFFEARLGHDFGRVRVHADGEADSAARALGADAYTVGHDVVFAARRYAPGSGEGRRLLAHELVHVVQQSRGGGTATPHRVSHAAEPGEREAEHLAAALSRPDAGTLTHSPVASVVRTVAAPGVVHRRAMPWPFNGYVINNSPNPVTVWNDSRGVYTIAANSTSGRFTEDVDHIQDAQGHWYKIGPNTVTVNADGSVSGAQCRVASFGQPCPSVPRATCTPKYLGGGAYQDEHCLIRQGLGGPKY